MDAAERLQWFLLREWSTGLRLTTIPQAMQRLGIVDDLRLRWRVGRQLETLWRDALTSPEKRRQITAALGRDLDEARDEQWRQQVAAWNLASILLSEGEKLVARDILLHQRKGQGLPQPLDIATTLDLPVRDIQRAFRMLVRLGFLSLTEPRRLASYALADDHRRFLEGLGFSFHTVTLDTGEQFGVP